MRNKFALSWGAMQTLEWLLSKLEHGGTSCLDRRKAKCSQSYPSDFQKIPHLLPERSYNLCTTDPSTTNFTFLGTGSPMPPRKQCWRTEGGDGVPETKIESGEM